MSGGNPDAQPAGTTTEQSPSPEDQAAAHSLLQLSTGGPLKRPFEGSPERDNFVHDRPAKKAKIAAKTNKTSSKDAKTKQKAAPGSGLRPDQIIPLEILSRDHKQSKEAVEDLRLEQYHMRRYAKQLVRDAEEKKKAKAEKAEREAAEALMLLANSDYQKE